MPFEIIESYYGKCAIKLEEIKEISALEFLFKKEILKIICGREPGGTFLEVINTEENGKPLTSFVLSWKDPNFTLNEVSSAYVNLCKKVILFLDENLNIPWEKIEEIREEVKKQRERLVQRYRIDFGCIGITRTNKGKKLNDKEGLIELVEELILEEQRNEGKRVIGSYELNEWARNKFSYLFPDQLKASDQAEFLVNQGDWKSTIKWLNNLDEEDWKDITLWSVLEILDPE